MPARARAPPTRSPPSRARTLARSYHQDEASGLDHADKEKLQMLETYMASLSAGGELGAESPSAGGGAETPLPSRAEDVDKFMAELAAAASGTPAADGEGDVEMARAAEAS